jgi:peptidyl-prolyl cis-trans isomerase A (cyclophilin A)
MRSLRVPAVLLALVALAAAAPRARQPLPADLPLASAAPDSFLATFETTKDAFTMKACRAWSPLGVDRLYHLVRGGYYDGVTIYRVGETKSVRGGRVVQFGQSGDTTVNHGWERATFADEPVVRPHRPGAVNFARGGPNTRGVEIAICTNTVTALDTVQYLGVTGFPVVAEVNEGLDVLAKLEGRYGNAPIENDSLSILGGAYLERAFPGLDRVRSARITKSWGGAKGDAP